MKFSHEKTNDVFKWFEEISKIPRCSKHEEKIAAWLVDWAKENGFEADTDKVLNVVIRVPASKGMEDKPIVVLQGHMDMVCEKTPDSDHDFCKDPIKLVYDGERWLTADKTTLGADNGIALAMAMAMALDKDLPHPAMELLFTVDEETGLTGANALEPGFIKGKILINIDSEDEGVFTVGCAGGCNTKLNLPLDFESVNSDYHAVKIEAGGMKGGHSGCDIAMGKANAIKVLSRCLDKLSNSFDIRVADIKGGSAHNAIPRDAEAFVFVKAECKDVQKAVAEFESVVKTEYKTVEPDMKITLGCLKDAKVDFDKYMTEESTRKLIDYLIALPHGVAVMSADIENLVETSNNLANIKIKDSALLGLTSQRSSVVSRLEALTARIENMTRLAGGKAESGEGYPPWQPNMESPLLAKSVALYEKLFNKKPVVEIIHAGLECGIIGDKYPGMDMISIGPDLRFPHCPDEKVDMIAVGMVWDFMAALFKEL